MPVDRFLRWRLFWRLRLEAEELLGRASMMVLAAFAGALIGLALLGSEHGHVLPVVMRHGRAVVETPGASAAPFWVALAGGTSGILVCFVLAFVWSWVRYRLWGDEVWEAVYTEGNFGLYCRYEHPVHVRELGAVECRVRMPSGAMLSSHHAGVLSPREAPVQGMMAHFDLPKEAGVYEARWYAMNGKRKLHEIGRIKTTIMP